MLIPEATKKGVIKEEAEAARTYVKVTQLISATKVPYHLEEPAGLFAV